MNKHKPTAKRKKTYGKRAFIFFDIESNGGFAKNADSLIQSKSHRMVSLSAKQGNDEFNVFIKSSNLYIPSYSTTEFHGISNDFIVKNGVDISLALRMFCDFLEKTYFCQVKFSHRHVLK